jgi:ribonucleoside-diphosphate reductase alpha chain
MSAYFTKPIKGFEACHNKTIVFNLDKIRPEGAPISGGFTAPGPEGLRTSLEKIREILEARTNNTEPPVSLRPIDAYDIIMHLSDACLSGGIRRSATICLFSLEDKEMLGAKTGNWFNENPQRGRSNNSAVLIRNHTKKEDFLKIKKSVMEYGEPGFVFMDDNESGTNPCCEISFRPVLPDGRQGWQVCNLSSVNGKMAKTKEDFIQGAINASIIGTIQAGYTDFSYVNPASRELTEKEALLGVSIAGVMDNPDITLDPEIQREAAKAVLETNEKVAKLLGINPAARATCEKPDGNSSCLLGTSSGIHPHHARRYMRRVTATKTEFPLRYFEMFNPSAVEDSVWSNTGTDKMITFLCEVPHGAITKNQLSALTLLENVKLTQSNWVEAGTVESRSNSKKLRHNVSNTITVQDDEWDEVFEYLWENQHIFTGVSMLSADGDKDYPQAPFTAVYTPKEMVKEYGDASVFASGLITAGLSVFGNDLWKACSHALGIEEVSNKQRKEMSEAISVVQSDIALTFNDLNRCYFGKMILIKPWKIKERAETYEELDMLRSTLRWFQSEELELERVEKLQVDWIRRAKQFAERYFDGDVKAATYCLKDVHNWKTWVDLSRDYVDVDWSNAYEEHETMVDADSLAGASCAGGNCEIT